MLCFIRLGLGLGLGLELGFGCGLRLGLGLDEMLCFIRLADDDAQPQGGSVQGGSVQGGSVQGGVGRAPQPPMPPLPTRVATEARLVPTTTPLVSAGLAPLRKALQNAPAALLEALKAAAHWLLRVVRALLASDLLRTPPQGLGQIADTARP